MRIDNTTRPVGLTGGMIILALVTPATAQIVTNNTEYQCAPRGCFSLTHNLSLDVTVRSITCRLPTSMAHYYDVSTHPDLGGEYSLLSCVDFSIWSSENPGNQEIFVRVYQDLTPEDSTPNAPEAGTCCSLLLGEATIVLPPSAEGVESSDPNISPGRSDGDFSISAFVNDFQPSGGPLLLPADASFWIEVGHGGEAQTRFGCNQAGEAGDLVADHRRTWLRTPGCGGAPADWVVHDTIFGDRDFVMQAHLNSADIAEPIPLSICPEDVDRNRFVGIEDFLLVLANWGEYGCNDLPIAGDVAPLLFGDRRVNISDFLAVLAAWGACPNPNDECTEVATTWPRNDFAQVVEGMYPWTIDGLLDGPSRPPTNDFNDVLAGPTTCGWFDYGEGGIPGGFRWGDAFGIDAASGAVGGDVWFMYIPTCSGPVNISTTSDCEPGRLGDTILEIYNLSPNCPGLWTELVACDDSSANAACGDHARIQLDLVRGNAWFLIRIGGRFGEQGTGMLSIQPEQFGAPDCNGNGTRDPYDVCMGISSDCNFNDIPDECETDCNGNGTADTCELRNNDCDSNGVPDECDPDCDGNGVPDGCQNWLTATSGAMPLTTTGPNPSLLVLDLPEALSDVTFSVYASADLADPLGAIDLFVDGWFVARFFELTGQACAAPGQREDFLYERPFFNILHTLDGNNDALIELVPVGIVDADPCPGGSFAQVSLKYLAAPTALDNGTMQDCNTNGIWDFCDIDSGASLDVQGDGVPDECGG